MLRTRVHNTVTGQRYEFTEPDQAAVDAKLAAKVAVYGQPEVREPARVVHESGAGYRIDDVDGSLTFTVFIIDGETETTVSTAPLFDTRPQWYAGGRTPSLEGQEVVIPAEREVVTTDITAEVNQAEAIRIVQARLDRHAQSWGYDNIFTACTYADEPAVPQFQAEGRALRAWRSATWAACYANTSAASIEELFAALPPPPDRP